MSSTEEVKNPAEIAPEGADISMSSTREEEAAKKKYGGMAPKRPPLLSKDNERTYFDSADWALNKQGIETSKQPSDVLRLKSKQQLTQKHCYRMSPMAPSGVEDGNVAAASHDTIANE